MSFQNTQKQIDDWCQQFKTPYWPPLLIMAKCYGRNKNRFEKK